MRSTLPDVEEEHMHIWAHELAQHLLVNHLVIASNSKFFDFTQASAFVVQFYDSRPLTPAALYPIVEEQMAGFTKESIEAVANTCHSYQALTFDGIVDAVDQITDLLEKRRKLHGLDNDKFPSRLLVLEGIDQSLEEITRSSSVLLAQAKLAPLLQKLTIISHTFFPKLSILIVNSVGSSPFITASHPAPALNSIFAVPATEPGLVQKSHLSYSSPLAKSLDRAIDTHLLVSHVGPNITVEVAKDRTGDALGRWCVL
ncbi:hypothetical protein AAP_04005 [Ascosphaera apis ARSEF 7405]|uniref:Uncharacterized protein n=1 Tax=Ascosphaera apis ARSEF 7405 TaxID=392613 RepID=A0A167XGA8_9EURO|nr:hypothetical protein AAP_04005 [Ascosphaera apis ARSEF 7405]